jgi:methylmalonyl-CoA/ethylmalonyl-CoA epimerase
MIKKIDHIGIAVKDLNTAKKKWKNILGLQSIKEEKIEEQGVLISIFEIETQKLKIELIAPLDNSSPLHKFLEKRGEGLHHICFEVDDIREMMRELEKNGLELIDKEPKRGEGNSLIAFIHPKSTTGVLMELKEYPHKND